MKEAFNIEEVALMSGLSTRTLRTYIASGFLKGEKMNGAWRFVPEALEAFFANKAVAPAVQAKRNAIIYDFMSGKPDGGEKMCVILDLPMEKAAAGMAFFCKSMNECKPKGELRFAADRIGKGERILLSGNGEDVMEMLNRFYGKDE